MIQQREPVGYGPNVKISLPGCSRCKELAAERDRLQAAIAEHHAQKADDRCVEDDDRLYAAAGLPPCDRRVGDKAEMLRNCQRFIERRCEGGGWPTYRELEAERDDLRSQLATAKARAEAFKQEANQLRERLNTIARPCAPDAELSFDPDDYPLHGCTLSQPRSYVCPYCQRPVTDLAYHEGPADCERERLRNQPPRLVDDTDPRG